jgi:fluoride exporter
VTALAVLLGSAVGAPVRRIIDHLVTQRFGGWFPWGTFAINVSGSFILGVALGLGSRTSGGTSAWWIALVGTGFCGGFTTFSTFAYESVRLSEEVHIRSAFLNVATSVVVGLGAVVLGWSLATGIVR